MHCEGDRAWEQFVRRGCGVSILGDIQKPSGQPGLGDCAWAEGLNKMTSRGHFQPQTFCDSVIIFQK